MCYDNGNGDDDDDESDEWPCILSHEAAGIVESVGE